MDLALSTQFTERPGKEGQLWEAQDSRCAGEQRCAPPAAATKHPAHHADRQEAPFQEKKDKHGLKQGPANHSSRTSHPFTYIENPKWDKNVYLTFFLTYKLIELVSEFSKFPDYKANIQNSSV